MELQAPEMQTVSETFDQTRDVLREVQTLIIEKIEIYFSQFLNVSGKEVESEAASPLDLQLQQEKMDETIRLEAAIGEAGSQDGTSKGLLLTAGMLDSEPLVEEVELQGGSLNGLMFVIDKSRENFKSGGREEFWCFAGLTPSLELYSLKLREKFECFPLLDKTLNIQKEWKRYKKKKR